MARQETGYTISLFKYTHIDSSLCTQRPLQYTIFVETLNSLMICVRAAACLSIHMPITILIFEEQTSEKKCHYEYNKKDHIIDA